MSVVASSYTPPRFLSSGHLQTLYASLVRRVDFAYDRRERIETPDDDFLDLDWAFGQTEGTGGATRDSTVAVLVHGLEGSANRRYMRGMARTLVRRGWDACAVNLRGCGGEMNDRVATYHSGKTDDLARIVRHALAEGYETLALVGFSLGGNIVLKYLGDRGSKVDDHIRRAVGISVPVDLASSAAKIGRLSNWHYTQYFLSSLRDKIRAKAEQHPDRVTTDALNNVYTLRDFDDAYTAPLHGFHDAADYYRRASSKPVLPNVARPTLLLNAANDPFLSPECYPKQIARRHDDLTLEIAESGGHVGFVSFNERGEYWSERRTAAFLSPERAAPHQPGSEKCKRTEGAQK